MWACLSAGELAPVHKYLGIVPHWLLHLIEYKPYPEAPCSADTLPHGLLDYVLFLLNKLAAQDAVGIVKLSLELFVVTWLRR